MFREIRPAFSLRFAFLKPSHSFKDITGPAMPDLFTVRGLPAAIGERFVHDNEALGTVSRDVRKTARFATIHP